MKKTREELGGQTLKKRFLSLFGLLFLHDAAPQLALPLPPRLQQQGCKRISDAASISFAPAFNSPWAAMQ
jgi:hypothetical protein